MSANLISEQFFSFPGKGGGRGGGGEGMAEVYETVISPVFETV